MKLTKEQIQILLDGKLEENSFYLQGQLERKQYTDINKVLETIWLKWNRWKKAHIADITWEELKESIEYICDTGEVETLQETVKKFQYFPTPENLASYVVELANIQDKDFILEPSAWQGAIINKIKNWVWYITAIEINKDNYNILQNKVEFEVLNMDFLEYSTKKFNKIIMNPPFSKNKDVKHILHAYSLLKKWGRLVSIASSMIQHKETKLHEELKCLNPEYIEIDAGTFKDSGTMVNTVIVVLDKL